MRICEYLCVFSCICVFVKIRLVDFGIFLDFLGLAGKMVFFYHKQHGAISSQLNTFFMGNAVFEYLCKSHL